MSFLRERTEFGSEGLYLVEFSSMWICSNRRCKTRLVAFSAQKLVLILVYMNLLWYLPFMEFVRIYLEYRQS